MPSMSEVIAEHTQLSADDEAWLRQLVEEWQLLADLSFSDLVLWVPEADENVFWAAAQIRPTTGPTALVDDVVGDLIAYSPDHLVTEAFLSGQITQTSEGKLQAGIPVGVHAVPVAREGRVIAVVEQHTNQLAVRSAGALERAYLQTATDLSDMVRTGAFPFPGHRPAVVLRPGDGFIRLDANGEVVYASPNALSAYRRLGLTADLIDAHLARLTDELVPHRGPIDESLESVLSGTRAREAEVVAEDAHVLIRSLPLTPDGVHVGAVVLLRDVTDLRSRERELMSKDATIREIHHRVKNNLQTVAALLRMQSRRIESEDARAALRDAMSRVASIAIVHETLSQTFDEVVRFDQVADHILRMVGDVAAHEGAVTARRIGSFGDVSAAVAANLSLVMTELCQNAIEHGLATGSGEVVVNSWVEGEWLHLQVWDNGRGLPEGFSLQNLRSLGLSIVSNLVSELGGDFDLGPRWDGKGTMATVDVPMSAVRRPPVQAAPATPAASPAGRAGGPTAGGAQPVDPVQVLGPVQAIAPGQTTTPDRFGPTS
ncbi:two-component sensor histidine kinase [Friedmanniella endophytica]|uniref:histidine kinase n=1 Tax=Microlunatus kandeliicorticis TaxID=1759536 RepID=A0A7W3IUN4_9ACTN|nr:PAS domain-containing sensor histidine kinase [Microlunatus kandeliicorticis]MBA8795588.1 two-component sensor histidine kinase [Microlunatus kandeliicorticis]